MAEVHIESVGKTYKIKIQGDLDVSWADWFDQLTFTNEKDGTTTLTDDIPDQAALHDVLKKIRDLGLPLLSVNHLDLDWENSSMEN